MNKRFKEDYNLENEYKIIEKKYAEELEVKNEDFKQVENNEDNKQDIDEKVILEFL